MVLGWSAIANAAPVVAATAAATPTSNATYPGTDEDASMTATNTTAGYVGGWQGRILNWYLRCWTT